MSVLSLIERFTAGTDCAVRVDSTWIHVTPNGATLPGHGWKLHISSRSATLPDLIETLTPVLIAERQVFKLAESQATLSNLNDAVESGMSVGKAFTIYPEPDRVVELGLALVELLKGWTGPRVLSDRRIDDRAPIYYRYGPFTAGWSADEHGRIGMFLTGPDGQRFDAEAGPTYRQPDWVRDPFAEHRTAAEIDDDPTLSGGRYRVVAGVYESPRGNVYRAVDRTTGTTVIVKQARALVAESDDGSDTRLRLRNERRILTAAAGIDGVPEFIDHFEHAGDEFLVITDMGERNLVDRIMTGGPYLPGPGLDTLVAELTRLVHALHDRGIVMRDLAPKNVIISPAGRIGLVDFGIAAYEGIWLPGHTPGYSRVIGSDGPRPVDDMYSLGMTLIHAATGVSPVTLDEARWSRTRALQTVYARYGASPPGPIRHIVDLVSDDADIAHHAFERLARRIPGGDTPRPIDQPALPATTLPAPPACDPSGIARELLEQVLRKVDALDPERTPRPDASVYTGTAGIGLELLHHRHHPGVPERIAHLVTTTAAFARRADLTPGLFLGRTGVNLFLRLAGSTGVDHEIGSGLPHPPDGTPDSSGASNPAEHDLISGRVGIALAHLELHARLGHADDLDLARRYGDRGDPDDYEGRSLAHGSAGSVLLQLALGSECPRGLDDLLTHTRALVTTAAAHDGDPLMTVSWCNGLTGIARVLLHAGRRLERDDCLGAAVDTGDALATWIPRLESIGQCCGVAGIGDLMLDLADVDNRFADVAHTAARQVLLRSAGPSERPEPVNPKAENAAAWSGGLTGLLGFFRRVRDGGGPRLFSSALGL